MYEPYGDWRKYYYAEAKQKRAIERKARLKKTFGAGAMVAAVLMEAFGRGSSGLLVGGFLLYQSGRDTAQQAQIHKDAIQELSESFGTEVEPMVVEVEGKTIELTGSVEEQYLKWRALLRQMYMEETGLPPEQTQNL
jgi:hypothetical protein